MSEYLDKTGLAYFWGKVKEKINAKASILDCYPVGAIYMSTSSTSPASLFGGTWEQISARFLLASGIGYDENFKMNYSYIAGNIGGEINHALTMKEVVQNEMWVANNNYKPNLSVTLSTGSAYGAYTYNQDAEPHNNMPPYLVVNMWKRIA